MIDLEDERYLDQNKYTTKVVYAGTSRRRLNALKQIPTADVVSFDGGDEPDISNVLKIALGKIEHVYPQAMDLMAFADNPGNIFIAAADSRTELRTTNEKRIVYESKSKPDDFQQTQLYFKKLLAEAEKNGKGIYRVVSSSAIQVVESTKRDEATSTTQTLSCVVHLNEKKLRWLTTQEGYFKYLEAFRAFYSSKAYESEGLGGMTITDLSGGISLPVLLRLGAVESVNGFRLNRRNIEAMKKAIRTAIFTVAVGFGSDVLEKINPHAMEYILAWNWLNEVTRHSLDLD